MAMLDFSTDCRKCHQPMMLNEGCEWPDDKTLILCWGCAIDEIKRLRKKVASSLRTIKKLVSDT